MYPLSIHTITASSVTIQHPRALQTGIMIIDDDTIPLIYPHSTRHLMHSLSLYPLSLSLQTGIMIIDDDTRMVVLEGLAKPGGDLQPISQSTVISNLQHTLSTRPINTTSNINIPSYPLHSHTHIHSIGPGGGMQSIYMDLPRPKENDQQFKMLCNPELLFSDRLYPQFGPEVKRIRLRDKLKKLARRPELYNRKQVGRTWCINVHYMNSNTISTIY